MSHYAQMHYAQLHFNVIQTSGGHPLAPSTDAKVDSRPLRHEQTELPLLPHGDQFIFHRGAHASVKVWDLWYNINVRKERPKRSKEG